MTSQPTFPGIFVTFSKQCAWGRSDGHGSRGSCPSAKAPALAQPERPGRVQASHLCPPCHALSVPGPADPAQQQSPREDLVTQPWCPSPWHVAHPPPSPGAWPGLSPMLGAELGARGHKQGTNQTSGFFKFSVGVSPCRAGMEEGSPHSPQVQVTTVGRGRRDWHPAHASQRGERGAYSCDTDS